MKRKRKEKKHVDELSTQDYTFKAKETFRVNVFYMILDSLPSALKKSNVNLVKHTPKNLMAFEYQ